MIGSILLKSLISSDSVGSLLNGSGHMMFYFKNSKEENKRKQKLARKQREERIEQYALENKEYTEMLEESFNNQEINEKVQQYYKKIRDRNV